ncbi:hypothetical protein Moror_8972 [Moniliophthora roreri MCA 2997]|uniref:Uncharacterized protein n=2 Tax=Moniliophthora roreri TaxID=221103 RepID=V2YMP7_MONRO|nr:hypothetical protein Moror_8972 [Moniliophthora roreri MCA 2997]
MMTPNPPGLPETGPLPRTLGTPLPGPSDQFPQSDQPPQSENNDNTKTTGPESQRSSSPTGPLSMTDFLDVINAINKVIIHRTVEVTNARSATHSNLTISLNIAHDFDGVNEFLSHALPAIISLLTALRITMVMLPPSATSLTNHTSTEVGSDEESTITTMVRITDDREPFTIMTSKREE